MSTTQFRIGSTKESTVINHRTSSTHKVINTLVIGILTALILGENMSSGTYDKLSEERKKLQAEGEMPEFLEYRVGSYSRINTCTKPTHQDSNIHVLLKL